MQSPTTSATARSALHSPSPGSTCLRGLLRRPSAQPPKDLEGVCAEAVHPVSVYRDPRLQGHAGPLEVDLPLLLPPRVPNNELIAGSGIQESHTHKTPVFTAPLL